MNRYRFSFLLMVALGASSFPFGPAAKSQPLEFDLQTRDPSTSQTLTRKEKIDPKKTAVVIVDPWNYHWCMTACERVSAMVPRWNRALECARKLGLPIIWAPSDVVGMYAGYPQRERALAIQLVPVPKQGNLTCRFTAPGGGCMCGPGINCAGNYGHDGMNPDLFLAEEDWIASSTEEVYAILHSRGITHVIYLGLHTNMCLFGKPGALRYMADAGLTCLLARDINDAITSYNPATGFTPDQGTRQTDEDLERAGIPTINLANEWLKAGLWNEDWIVETVRITPWGKPMRPYFFQRSVTVTLTTPWLEDVQIRYTLDDTEPTGQSRLYEKPLRLAQTVGLRAAAFRGDRRVSIPTSAYYVHLGPMPPKPEVYLDELPWRSDPYGELAPVFKACLWIPKVGLNYEGQPLRVRGKKYAKGLGFRAPSNIRYELKPEYDRFVALAGIADNLLEHELGRNLVMHCSVVFRVFIDGQLAAQSPAMRISQEPWRFDLPIPAGSRQISLACMDAGSRNILDLGNWVDAGFVLKEGSPGKPAAQDTDWDGIPVPGAWESAPGGKWAKYDGFACYRCCVKVPKSWANRPVSLYVEQVDNYHEAYVNGVKVGGGDFEQDGWGLYPVPGNQVRAEDWNLIAIRVEDQGGAGGIRGLAPVLYAGDEAIELKGDWQFQTGDNLAWTKRPTDFQPPAIGRFDRVVPAASVPRKLRPAH